MEFDYSKLKGKIVECYKNQGAFAKELKQSERTVSLKLNNHVPFSDVEIVKWCKALSIPLTNVGSYFFTPYVQKSEHDC